MMKRTTHNHRTVVLSTLTGVVLLFSVIHAGAQTVTPQFDELILGFRATGAPGQTLNLEVDLGNMSNFYGAAPGSTIPLSALSVQDLSDVYGSSWYTRTDLVWGAVSTTGRVGGTPDGHAPVGTFWASAQNGQTPWNRESAFAQKTASATIEAMYVVGSAGTLYGATATSNSPESAVINATLIGSWSVQELKTLAESFNFFNPPIDNVATVPAGGQVVSQLYELQPTNVSGIAGTLLGNLILTRTGLSFQAAAPAAAPIASFTGTPTNGTAPLMVSFNDTSTESNGTITNRFWSFGDGSTTNVTTTSVVYTYAAAGSYSVALTVYGTGGSGTVTLTNYVLVTAATAPTIATSSLPNGTVGNAYTYTLAATGGTPPYTWSVVSNALPSGLELVAATGVITGTPTVATTANFTVQVEDTNNLSSDQSFALTINPAASRVIGLSGNLAFGNVSTGVTATATLTVSSSGNSSLTVTDISYPAGFSGAFSGVIAAGGSTNVTVTFLPTALTSYGGTVTINSDATSGTATIGASGTGVLPLARIIGLSGNLTFGNVITGTMVTATLTIANTGNTNLTVASISYPSGFSGAFSGVIMAGGATNVAVTFSPTALTSYGGTVTVNANQTSGMATITVSGTGVLPPTRIIALSGNLAFGNVTTGTTAVAALTISNAGSTNLTVAAISYPSGFSGAFSGVIAAGGATNVTVTFAPTALTSYGGTITVASDATGGTSMIAVFGAGVAAPTIVTSSPLPTGTVGVAYSQQLAANGGLTPYHWSLASGQLPLGLALSGTGIIGGTPLVATNVSFSIRVIGSNGLSSVSAFSLAIRGAGVEGYVPGRYDGLVFLTNNVAGEIIGSARITVTKSGAFQAQVQYNGTKSVGRGQFNASGDWAGTLGALSGTLHLDVVNNTDQITGTLTTGNFTGSLLANRAIYSAANPAPWAGSYTTLLVGPDNPSVPAGLGWANLQISSDGWVVLSGQLADGSRLHQVVPVSKYGTWPLFDVPSGLYSLLAGWVTMTNSLAVFNSGSMLSAVNADLIWYQPAAAGRRFFPNGFSTELTLVGSPYTVPAPETPVLSVLDTNCNTVMVFGGGTGSAIITNTVTLTLTDRVIDCGDGTLSFAVTPSTGSFSGTFVPSGTTKKLRFSGLFLQNGNVGGGTFLGSDATGYVTVEPIIETP
ncbi:MAG: choice-of-anchor D domain-containing protein [Verrucomicrobiia bacterium]